MTEPAIRDLLSFVEAERAGALELAGELAELAQRAEDMGAAAMAIRLATAARTQAAKVEVIDRLAPRGYDSEDTQPITLGADQETCSRCHGTGEVPVCRS